MCLTHCVNDIVAMQLESFSETEEIRRIFIFSSFAQDCGLKVFLECSLCNPCIGNISNLVGVGALSSLLPLARPEYVISVVFDDSRRRFMELFALRSGFPNLIRQKFHNLNFFVCSRPE